MNEITPQKVANKISQILTRVFGEDHFPVNIHDLASQYSKDICPNKDKCSDCKDKDCICCVCGLELSESIDGLLRKTPQGWTIIYNKAIKYSGRINFTLAHELGHYILHRKKYPDGLKCDKDDINKDENKKMVENEANTFASYLLMPLDDFRKASQKYTFCPELFNNLSKRYNTSLTATVLKWIEMTDKEAMVVFSDNGFILWKKQSKALLKRKVFPYKTDIIEELPLNSLSSRVVKGAAENQEKNQKNIWGEGLTSEEIVFNAPYLESVITVILFENLRIFFEEQKEEDCFDKILRHL